HKRLPPPYGPFAKIKLNVTLHVHLLPFIEQENLYNLFYQGSPPNPLPPVPPFIAPQDVTQIFGGAGAQNFAANLRVFDEVGLEMNTAPKGDQISFLPSGYGAAVLPLSIPDGTSNTISFTTMYMVCQQTLTFNTPPIDKFGKPFPSPFFASRANNLPASP